MNARGEIQVIKYTKWVHFQAPTKTQNLWQKDMTYFLAYLIYEDLALLKWEEFVFILSMNFFLSCIVFHSRIPKNTQHLCTLKSRFIIQKFYVPLQQKFTYFEEWGIAAPNSRSHWLKLSVNLFTRFTQIWEELVLIIFCTLGKQGALSKLLHEEGKTQKLYHRQFVGLVALVGLLKNRCWYHPPI